MSAHLLLLTPPGFPLTALLPGIETVKRRKILAFEKTSLSVALAFLAASQPPFGAFSLFTTERVWQNKIVTGATLRSEMDVLLAAFQHIAENIHVDYEWCLNVHLLQ